MDVLEARFPARATAKSLYIAGSFFFVRGGGQRGAEILRVTAGAIYRRGRSK